jgi:hypothetical protein
MDQATDISFWELSLIMAVIASWILYRYVAPKGWREWSRAGLIQAFIIALYAEMYGFPLTIYLLTGWLGIDIPWAHESGHLWAAVFGWGGLGAMIEMLVGYTLVFMDRYLPCRFRSTDSLADHSNLGLISGHRMGLLSAFAKRRGTYETPIR